MFKYLAIAVLAVSSAAAASLSGRSLPSGTVTCGSDKYSVSQITAAINAGVKDMQSGNLPGQYYSGVVTQSSTYISLQTTTPTSTTSKFRMMPDFLVQVSKY